VLFDPPPCGTVIVECLQHCDHTTDDSALLAIHAVNALHQVRQVLFGIVHCSPQSKRGRVVETRPKTHIDPTKRTDRVRCGLCSKPRVRTLRPKRVDDKRFRGPVLESY